MVLISPKIASAGHWEDWKEEALLHDGRVVLVERSLYFEFKLMCGDGGSPHTHCNVPTTYKISFHHPGTQEAISWEGGFVPAALEIIDQVPYLVVVGTGVPVEMGTYPVCNGTPYLYYRYDKVKSRWEVLNESGMPKELTKANLGFGYDDRSNGKLLSHAEITRYNQWKEKQLSAWFVVHLPKNFEGWSFYDKWGFAASQRRMYKGTESCKNIKPEIDPEVDENRKISRVLENSAKTVDVIFIGLDRTTETFTEEQYKATMGNFGGVAWLKPSCIGIVDKIEEPVNLTGPYSRQITFKNGKRSQLTRNYSFPIIACSNDMVYVIRPKDHANLVVNRYRATGEVVDVTKVALDESKLPNTEDWPKLLRIQPVSKDEIIIEFAQLEEYQSKLLAPVYSKVAWKAKFKVNFKHQW